MVTLSVPATRLVEGSDVFEMDLDGEALNTVSVADEVLPLPPLVDVTVPVVLAYDPAVAATTATVMVQLPFAAIVPPLRLILPPPAAAVSVPPQVFVVARGVALTKPDG